MAPRNLPTSSNHPNQFRSQARDDFSRSVANNIYGNRSEEEIHLCIFLSFLLSFFRNGFFKNTNPTSLLLRSRHSNIRIVIKNSFPSELLFSTLPHDLRAMFPAASFTDRNKTVVVEISDLT
ncbi:hypothetical protein ALC57_10075 [Trachymyrmex cornetzi]|uniref:Uncharacterized protein n=1 Tax=Trachymyrmex cornetzi TaxID=471704 RepID=A0A195DY08_9HYME|nr:hypothetical protein ALC57_10075 [Trachymyrmex cornetzi]